MGVSARSSAAIGGAMLGAGMGAALGVALDDAIAGVLMTVGFMVLWAVVFRQAAVSRTRNGED